MIWDWHGFSSVIVLCGSGHSFLCKLNTLGRLRPPYTDWMSMVHNPCQSGARLLNILLNPINRQVHTRQEAKHWHVSTSCSVTCCYNVRCWTAVLFTSHVNTTLEFLPLTETRSLQDKKRNHCWLHFMSGSFSITDCDILEEALKHTQHMNSLHLP